MKKTVYLLLLIFIFSNNLFGQDYERYKKLLDTTITSKHLGFDKNITITVPFEWQKNTNRDFPLIIIFDRQNTRSHNFILNTIDYLSSNEQMPSSIIISVESEQKYRYLETLHKASSEKGLAEENEKFIFDELIPLAEKKYNASSFRLFIGHSRYGYFTSALLISRINELNGIIALSPFFTQTNVDLIDSIQTVENQVFNSPKYYRFGIGNDYPSDFLKMDSVIKQHNNSELNAKGFLFKEADHNVTPGLTIGVSLYEIFENWSKSQSKYLSNDQKDLKIIDTLEEEIIINYGNRLEFSLGVLNGKGWYFYNEKEYRKSIEAWGLLIKSYPNFSEGYLYIMDAQVQLNQDISETIEKFNTSLAKSDLYSETEKKELIKAIEDLKK
jgi:predicted alpha/beta superfamily hydrolase